jgi:hypothetical protein
MSDLRKKFSLDHLLSANEPKVDVKLKQDQRVYFKIREGMDGFASVAGDYDLLVILKPEKPIGPYSHIYVTRTQIVDLKKDLKQITKLPVVEEEVDDGL